jgi:hypothetical protein
MAATIPQKFNTSISKVAFNLFLKQSPSKHTIGQKTSDIILSISKVYQ